MWPSNLSHNIKRISLCCNCTCGDCVKFYGLYCIGQPYHCHLMKAGCLRSSQWWRFVCWTVLYVSSHVLYTHPLLWFLNAFFNIYVRIYSSEPPKENDAQ